MLNRIELQKAHSSGFTLMELMITVAIVGLLASIALPSYTKYVLRSHRTEAKNALLDLASREESIYATTNNYSAVAGELGYNSFTPVGSGYYNVAIELPSASKFTITATAIGNQTKDTSCQIFTVDQTGSQSSLDNAAAVSTATCWQK